MGLFDIFRRHKKKKQEESAATSAPTTPVSAASAQPTSPTSEAAQPTTPAPAETQPTPAEEESAAQTTQTTSAPTEPTTAPESTQSTTAPSSVASEQPQPTKARSAEPTTPEPAVSAAPTAPREEPVSASETAPTEPVSTSVQSTAPASTSVTEPKSASAAPTTPASTSTTEPAPASVAPTQPTTPEPAASEAPAADTEDRTEKKYDKGLEKSRTGFGARLNRFLANFRHVDEDFFDDLEDMLIESDVGYDMAMKLSDELREEVKLENAKSKQDVSNVIIEKMVDLYDEAGKDENPDLQMAKEGPTVIMFVGVNGAGKTTTIGKMAALFKKQGKKVLLAAADTFRAGATEQLDVWAKRDGIDIVTGPENGDPAAVVFDAVQKAKKEDYNILFVDTAGRLQNKVNLMNELAKMKRILTREIPDAPHEVLLVLDATTGQNALNQAKLFKQSTDVTGIVLTKLDGTARGGIVLAIRNELHLPVKYVGLGEKVDDLQKFNASDFVYGLFKGLVEVD
ncbi:signal recognition particle-docking protein FtsY [Limosilactobacillus panis DSM 6035]|jgi:fused signal recognition particle receptor|uniref:Signal recognition particle receptor FtsY n=2 Tax=Limosilactobacillus panis TaxID=47493 RepID=A0A0R1XIM5_9LACO|nr:signal recognition particle-docking protein FtsY [Limosilactobacillus panis]KRM30026.1 signal recognition particle-docking protein FtsY [Limosilactobacillus panis DSM 6035]